LIEEIRQNGTVLSIPKPVKENKPSSSFSRFAHGMSSLVAMGSVNRFLRGYDNEKKQEKESKRVVYVPPPLAKTTFEASLMTRFDEWMNTNHTFLPSYFTTQKQ
jgi:hypothetical protein